MKPHEFFQKLQNELPQLERRIAADIVAVEAQNFHAKNFRDESFTDVASVKWPARKPNAPRNRGRSLLVDSGTMRGHALSAQTVGDTVRFVFPLDYEQVHNEGGRAGRGGGFQMPKRQFVGESEYLNKKIEAKAKRFLDAHLNNL